MLWSCMRTYLMLAGALCNNPDCTSETILHNVPRSTVSGLFAVIYAAIDSAGCFAISLHLSGGCHLHCEHVEGVTHLSDGPVAEAAAAVVSSLSSADRNVLLQVQFGPNVSLRCSEH